MEERIRLLYKVTKPSIDDPNWRRPPDKTEPTIILQRTATSNATLTGKENKNAIAAAAASASAASDFYRIILNEWDFRSSWRSLPLPRWGWNRGKYCCSMCDVWMYVFITNVGRQYFIFIFVLQIWVKRFFEKNKTELLWRMPETLLPLMVCWRT